MSNKKEFPSIDQRLKWELYGQLIACGLMATVVLIMAVRHKKEPATINVTDKIEQVQSIKNNAVDSVNYRAR